MVEWSLGYLWRWTNLLERFWLTALALMVLYVLVVAAGFYRRSRFARAFAGRKDRESSRAQNKIATAMRLDVNGLRLVSDTAPYLGLAGMCSGILDVFRGYDLSLHRFIVVITSISAAALMATAAGIVVAIFANCLYRHLHRRLEAFESERLPRIQLPKPIARPKPMSLFSGLPPFALLAAPCLASFIVVYIIFGSFHRQVGVSVWLKKPGRYDDRLTVESTVVGVKETNRNGPTVYINSEETRSDDLMKKLLRDARLRPNSQVYFQAQNDTSWQHVLNVIDLLEGLHVHVVLLTAVYSGPGSRGVGEFRINTASKPLMPQLKD
jgi:biopolymer transport protein ExbD